MRYLVSRAIVLLLTIVVLASGCSRRDPGLPIDVTQYNQAKSLMDDVNRVERQFSEGEDYYLGPGDVLYIALLGRPDILDETIQRDPDRGFVVTDSPYLTLPLIGQIKVHGRTVSQLQVDLKASYSKFIRDPEPIIFVKKFSYNQISVVGSVQKPGRYPLDFGDTLLDGVFKAGGLSMGGRSGGLAPSRYLKVYREKLTRKDKADMSLEQMLDLVTVNDQVIPREEIVIPIQEFLFYGRLNYNIPLFPNDIVYVPPAGTASVIGRVENPGVVFLGPSVSTLTQALTERGGMRYGAESDVEVVRMGLDGESISYYVNARAMLKRKQPDFVLQDGDQIFVYTHSFRNILEWVGNALRTSVRAGASATYNPVQ